MAQLTADNPGLITASFIHISEETARYTENQMDHQHYCVMKLIITLIGFGVLTFAGHTSGQVFTTKNGMVVVTNPLTLPEVVRVASSLRIGMCEEEASWVLATNK